MGFCSKDWCKNYGSDKCDNCIEYYDNGTDYDDISYTNFEPKDYPFIEDC